MNEDHLFKYIITKTNLIVSLYCTFQLLLLFLEIESWLQPCNNQVCWLMFPTATIHFVSVLLW